MSIAVPDRRFRGVRDDKGPVPYPSAVISSGTTVL